MAANRDTMQGTAFVGADGEKISFATVGATAAAIAHRLVAEGIRPTDRVALTVPRSHEGLVSFLGISSVGICCPLNPGLRDLEYEAFFRSARPAALIEACPSRAAVAAERFGTPVIDLLDNRRVSGGPADIGASACASGQERHALLMQTSGTTARPKTVLLTHENIIAATSAIGEAFCLGSNDLCLNLMPLHHVHGLISAGIASLLAGSPAICSGSFSPEAFDATFEALQPTWFTGSPTMHIALREYYRSMGKRPDNPRLRFFRSSSAPLPKSLIVELEALFAAPLLETYGLTETASLISTNPLPPLERKVGSVGVACGAQMKVVDKDDKTAVVGETGEIVIRGPSVITRYGDGSGSGSGTAPESFLDGWLRTGDMGYVDEDGYYFITGRSKELIKRGGLSVYPNEIDSLLLADARVAEAATFSLPHPTLGEEVVAVVVAAEGHDFTGSAIREQLFGVASTYKVPAEIVVVDAIPKTETGKINRLSLSTKLCGLFEPRREPASTADEARLLEVWFDILDREDFGVTDNIVLLGADPARCALFVKRLLGSQASLGASDIFRFPTVREQIHLVAQPGE